jgi:hypothetical protein
VASVLLRLALLLPDVVAIASDGRWDREWAYGAQAFDAGQPTGLGARTVVAELFDVAPVDSALRATLDGVRLGTDILGEATADLPPMRRFQVGQPVHVDAFGNWRPGTVTKIGRSQVTVRYQRNAYGDTAERAFAPGFVRPAHGVSLVPVDDCAADSCWPTATSPSSTCGPARAATAPSSTATALRPRSLRRP